MHTASHSFDDVEKVYMLGKREEEDYTALNIALMHRYVSNKRAQEDWLQ